MSKARKSTDTIVRTTSRYLPVRLSDDELRDRGSSLAHIHEKLDDLDVEQALANGAFKERRKLMASEAKRLARIVREKAEQREVGVEVRLSTKAGEVDEIRLDTGEVLLTRKMENEEAQVPLLDGPAMVLSMREAQT